MICYDCGKKLRESFVLCVVCACRLCVGCDVRAVGAYEEPHCRRHQHPINHLPLDTDRKGWLFDAHIEVFLPAGREEDVSWRQDWIALAMREVPGVIDWRYNRAEDQDPAVGDILVLTADLRADEFRWFMLNERKHGLCAVSVHNARPVAVRQGYEEGDFMVKVLA